MTKEIIAVGSTVGVFTGGVLEEINKGLEKQGFITCPESESHVKFEFYAREVQEGGGKISFHIFQAGIKGEDSNTQKVIVYAKRKDEVAEAERAARIAEAQKRERNANSELSAFTVGV